VGWEQKTITILGLVSRHNSEHDREDDELWADAQKRIGEIVEDPKYGDINLEASGLADDD